MSKWIEDVEKLREDAFDTGLLQSKMLVIQNKAEFEAKMRENEAKAMGCGASCMAAMCALLILVATM